MLRRGRGRMTRIAMRTRGRPSDRESLTRLLIVYIADKDMSSSPALTSSSSASASKGKSKAMSTSSFNVADSGGRFWRGAIRQTANKHTIPSQDTKPVFRISEILPPRTPSSDPDNALSFALVSSYAVDLPWLYQLFPPDVPVILVAQPGQDGRAEVHHALPGWVRASPALAGGRGCMHVKVSASTSLQRGC